MEMWALCVVSVFRIWYKVSRLKSQAKITYFITLILPILQESHFNSAIIDVIVDFVLLGCFWSILILFCEFQHCCKDENSLFLSWQVNFSSLPCSFTPFMKLYSHMTGRRCKRKNLPMVESGKISPKNIVESSHNSANLGRRSFVRKWPNIAS